MVSFALMLSAGCSSVGLDGSVTHRYMGLLSVVESPADSSRLRSSDTTVLGFYSGRGVGLGFVRDRQLIVPLDCRLVFLIADAGQLDAATRRLEALEAGQGRCVAFAPNLVHKGEPE